MAIQFIHMERFIYREGPEEAPIYDFDTTTLADDEMHIFAPVEELGFGLLSSCIECTTFHPTDRAQSEKFKISIVKFGLQQVLTCSFPSVYRETFERIGNIFSIALISKANTLIATRVDDEAVARLEFPKKDNIFWLDNACPFTDLQIRAMVKRIEAAGKKGKLDIAQLSSL